MTVKQTNQGFTLLEVLVALTLFALVSVIAYTGLTQVLTVQYALIEEQAHWQTVQRVFQRLEGDLQGALPRASRNALGSAEPAMLGGAKLPGELGAQLVFSRRNYHGQLQRVAYRVRAGRLEWLLWQTVDLAPRQTPEVFVLLDGVQAFYPEFMDKQGLWQAYWPQGGEYDNPLPRAVRIRLVYQAASRPVLDIQRVFLVSP